MINMNDKRNKTVGFRVTSEEKIMIKQAAEAFQKTVSGFIRDIILGISGDVVKIRSLNNNNLNYNSPISYKPVKKLNLPKPPRSSSIPQTLQNESTAARRGSALDFKNCMAELKKVLKEKVLIEG